MTSTQQWGSGTGTPVGTNLYNYMTWGLQPFRCYANAAYPWDTSTTEFPETTVTFAAMGTGQPLTMYANIYRWLRLFRVRLRIEWQYTKHVFEDAGTATNQQNIDTPLQTLYIYRSQLLPNNLQEDGQTQATVGNILGMGNAPIMFNPDQLDIGGNRAQRPYSQLFDVKGIKRIQFSRSRPVKVLAWRPLSFISRAACKHMPIKLAQNVLAMDNEDPVPYEHDTTVGTFWTGTDMRRNIAGGAGDLGQLNAQFKFTWYFDYKLSGKV